MHNEIEKLNISSPNHSGLWLVLLAALAVPQSGCSAAPGEDGHDHDPGAADDDFEYSATAGGLAAPGAWNPPPHVRNAGAGQFVPYHDAPPWNGGANCSGTLHPGTKQLGDFLKANFPGRVSSYGGYACRQNTANKAKTSVHGTGRALDVFIPLDGGQADNGKGDEVANWLILNAQAIGVQYIIWDRADWGGSRKGDKMGAYGGPHPHHDHIHVELTHEGAAKQTPWFNGGPPPTPYLTAGHLGDFDGDGRPDVAGMSADGDSLWIHRNTGTPGSFSKAGGQWVSSGWGGVRNYMLSDYDGDGKTDILGQADDSLLLWRSTSTATSFSVAPFVSFGTGWNTFSKFLPPADLDGDGKPDIAGVGATGDDLWVHRNTGTPGKPSKAAGTYLSSGWASVSNYMGGDFDGDTKYDIAGLGHGDILLVWPSTSTADQFSVAPFVSFDKGWSTFGRFLTTAPIR